MTRELLGAPGRRLGLVDLDWASTSAVVSTASTLGTVAPIAYEPIGPVERFPGRAYGVG